MTAPLEGIRVLELASFVAAPSAGALLADLGAEVVKVEIPDGEIYRHSRPRLAGIKHDFPEAPQFQMDNRGKRSLAVDLTREPAQKAVRALVDRADIFLTNMLPHRLERYGLDPDTLRNDRPELIVGVLSGYGREGPDAKRPSFDYTAYWARSGMMDQMRDAGAPPTFLRPGIGDHAAALSLTTGILSALRMRDRDGLGQVIDVSLMHIGLYVLGNDSAQALATGEAPPAHDRSRPRNPLWNQYQTADDRWLFLVMIESERYWEPLCRVLGRDDLLADERFKDPRERYRQSAELVVILEETFRTQTLTQWEETFRDQNVIWAPVVTLSEATRDPQARAAGVFTEVEHPVAGRYETIAPPLKMSRHKMRGEKPGPALGEENEALLREAGLSTEEIAQLLER
ncbi:MAG: CoA transferase [Candidatus Binatia bacterium]|nr:CoA transferase [Candidatus Binatia bacterium]